jgi:hypothetical protein
VTTRVRHPFSATAYRTSRTSSSAGSASYCARVSRAVGPFAFAFAFVFAFDFAFDLDLDWDLDFASARRWP